MSVPQRYQSLSLLCFILFFGIAKCDNVYCYTTNCQSSQSFDATGTGQIGSFLFTLGAGYEITLDIYPSSNEQDWSIDIASIDTVSQMTVSALLGSQAQIGPVTGAHLTGTFYLTQAIETSRYVRFRIKNTNSILSDQIALTLTVTRFVPLHYSGATRSFKLNGVIIVAVAGAVLVLIIIGVTVCCIRRRRRLALQKRQQAANRSAIDPIVNNTQLTNTSFPQQNMAYMQDSSFTPQQFGRPTKAQLEFVQPATQMYMPTYPQPQLQLQVQVQPQPQQIMVQPAPQGY